MVENVFSGMMDPSDTGVTIIELDDDDTIPKKRRRRAKAPKPDEEDPRFPQDIDMIDMLNLQDSFVNEANMRDITMVEHDYPPPLEEMFGDEPMPLVQDREPMSGSNIVRSDSGSMQSILLRTSIDDMIIRNLATHHEPPNLQTLAEETVDETHAVVPSEQGKGLAEQGPADQGPAEQGSAEQGPIEQGPRAEESINTSNISLLSGRKRKRRAVAAPGRARRFLPMKVYWKGSLEMRNYAKSPAHLRKFRFQSWKDVMATQSFKIVEQMLVTPLLPIPDLYYETFFSLEAQAERVIQNKQLRRSFQSLSPIPVSITGDCASSDAGQQRDQEPGRLSASSVISTGRMSVLLGNNTVDDGKDADRAAPSSAPGVVQGSSGIEQAGVIQNDAPPEQATDQREFIEEETPRKRRRLKDMPFEPVASPVGHWERVELEDKISQLWATKGSPITFYDICPVGDTSPKVAAKVMSALLDLHLKKEVVLDQNNPSKCTPILIYQPGMQNC